MTSTTSRDDRDRATSRRFVRNLALSLSGGAVLTLLGATAAHAQDQATSDSSGTGATGTGDATAVGNHSGTDAAQTGTISGGVGSLEVVSQNAVVSNTGVAIANTGGNRAVGNSSDNTATANQTAADSGGGAVNNGKAGNGSNGSATITTGNASAVGNSSNTSLSQNVSGSAHGQMGGILIVSQNSAVINSGVALANTGGNRARGNGSDNDATLLQTAFMSAGLGVNSGKATNDSDGKATISTGNASAIGNHSDTSVTQSTAGSAGGDDVGGLTLITQGSLVANAGLGVANTGGNRARGNVSNGAALVSQPIGSAPVPDPTDPAGIGANSGEASNSSDGTAGITTGDAGASGNDSTTTVRQDADATDQGGGLTLIAQGTGVLNAGVGIANTGGNRATGNDADNGVPNGFGAILVQQALSGPDIPSVDSNSGEAANASDGDAWIGTGSAWAAGNRSRTEVAQSATTEGGNLNIYPQVAAVANVGVGTANTGGNRARGNTSNSDTQLRQGAAVGALTGAVDDVDALAGVAANAGSASSSSDGSASITTGSASAVGNESTTTVDQTIDPVGLVLPTQVAVVLNAGAGVADTGNNLAVGNDSGNSINAGQAAYVASSNSAGNPIDIDAGAMIASNSGEASNSSDGSASIATGNAAATGNHSATAITQDSTGTVEGLGLVLNTQAAAVANVGVAEAVSGRNTAIGNESGSRVDLSSQADVAWNNLTAGPTEIDAGLMTAATTGKASNSSDGTAGIVTGHASATGNRSTTTVVQREDATIDGIGAVINTQVAVVANVGVGVANSGRNEATGNTSFSRSAATRLAEIGSFNGVGQNDSVDMSAPLMTSASSAEVGNTSDGTANITTGAASAAGNTSATEVVQATSGRVDGLGLVVNTQLGGVVNAGLAVADSGRNEAVGNNSQNTNGNNTPGATLNQFARIGSANLQGSPDIHALGAMTAANEGTASNTSDGTATIRTGRAQAQGNRSTTALSQTEEGAVPGAVVNTQVGGVANVGVGIANSGNNEAFGNETGNVAGESQFASIGSNQVGPIDIVALGSMTAHNAGEASNSSDGTATVGTGNATASGNLSSTELYQHQSSEVTDLGLVVGTQVGGVANVGVGVANSGANRSVGNESDNRATTNESADFESSDPAPQPAVLVIGSIVADNGGQATNASDGEACVCTGDATASGNESTTTLIQDLDTTVGTGIAVLTEAGGVLNAGVGIANSGLNLAIGNTSDNTATATQTADVDDTALDPGDIVGPQIVHNGGGANNASDGTGKVGTGKATAVGNHSATYFVQAAASDSDFAVATLAGGTTNAGLGLANSGVNVGIGNASTNVATLTQTADGEGIVANDGTADNSSDGTAKIGDPNCDVPGAPGGPSTPGVPSLPKTGGPLEAEALFGLMLLLAGFGLRRKGSSLA